MNQPLTISVAEAARITGLSRHAIRRAARDGSLPSIWIGRLLRIPRIPLLKLFGAGPAENEEAPL